MRNFRSRLAPYAGFVALALLGASCTESAGPEGALPRPRFSVSPNGHVTLDQQNGALGESGNLIIKGFNPTNPHRGDAVVATFFWLGSTNIIDSVTDVLTTNPYTPVGNRYTLVEYVTAGGYSMATYVATNVQNFPDPNTDPGGSDILAVGAYLSQSVADGGVSISAWMGIEDNFAVALGEHRSNSGSMSAPATAQTGPIGNNAGALAYTVTMSGLYGLDGPAGFTSLGQGSDNSFKIGGAYAVPASAGTVDPAWTWYAGSPGTWLVSNLALNAVGAATGALTASTSTSGSNIDPDGYVVTVDGGANQAIGVNGTVTFNGLAAGSHNVALSGLAANCSVSGSNPQSVDVPSGGTATAAFTVTCTATTGSLTANTTSSGASIPASYTVAVDGTQSQTIASTGSVTFTGLSAANHTVALTVPSNCTVSGGASQTVTVPAGGTVSTTFTVTCIAPPGNLTVTSSTSGLSQDLDGYTVTVDGGPSQAIATNGSVTFTGLSAGSHSIALSGVAVNCTVTSSNPSAVTVLSNQTISTTFSVSCVPGPATRLVYTVQPSNTAPLATITPAVKVKVVDPQGNTVTTYTGPVSIAIAHNGGLLLPGTLSGTTTVTPVNGVATFSDLSIDQKGNGYTLRTTSPGLTSAVSASFNIAIVCVGPLCL